MLAALKRTSTVHTHATLLMDCVHRSDTCYACFCAWPPTPKIADAPAQLIATQG